jgi:phosphoribosylformylglycinamidine synthase subunit PurL
VRRAQEVVRDAVRRGELRSAHDVAEGGLAVALAECCLGGGHGASVDFRGAGAQGERLLETLFGEGAGGFVLSGPRPALAALAREIQLTFVGEVAGDELVLALDGDVRLSWPLAELRAARARGLADALDS